MCSKHYQRVRRTGTIADRSIGYAAIHARLKVARGWAKTHLCIDCGQLATDWSYIGGCPEERRSTARASDHNHPFCEHLTCYEPRCRTCHKTYDWARIKQQEAK